MEMGKPLILCPMRASRFSAVFVPRKLVSSVFQPFQPYMLALLQSLTLVVLDLHGVGGIRKLHEVLEKCLSLELHLEFWNLLDQST